MGDMNQLKNNCSFNNDIDLKSQYTSKNKKKKK